MNSRVGVRHSVIAPDAMTPREKLKRRAVSVLSKFMVFDVTDDELDLLEEEVSRASKQMLVEVRMLKGQIIFWDMLVENFFRRCLRAADDWLFVEPENILNDFCKSIYGAIEELQEEGVLPR